MYLRIISCVLLLHAALDLQAQDLNLEDPNIILVDENGRVFNKDSLIKVFESGLMFTIGSDTTLENGKRHLTIIPMDFEAKSAKSEMKETNFIEIWTGKDFPSFNFTDMNDGVANLESNLGKVFVVNFWFIGCKPCLDEMPILNELVKEYADKEITFIAFTFDDRDKVQNFLLKRRFDYRVISESKPLLQEMNAEIFPTHMVVDKEGVIRWIKIGLTTNIKKELVENIEKVAGN